MTVINNNSQWKNHTETQESINKIQGQDVGTIRSLKVTVSADNEQVYMVEMENSLHTSLILTNWATNRR